MSGGVFISYRRNDAASAARAIYDHLANAFGANAVFHDSAVLQPGDKWGAIFWRNASSPATFFSQSLETNGFPTGFPNQQTM